MTRGSALWLQEVYHQPELRKKLREHRFDVIHLARYRAKKAVEAALRDQGRRVTLISPSELRVMAQAELELNRISLIAEVEKTIATSPLFARYRLGANIKRNAQSREQPKSITSAVQNSCTK